MRYSFQLDGQIHQVILEKATDGYRATVDGEEHEIQILRSGPGEISFLMQGHPYTARIAQDNTRVWAWLDGRTYLLESGRESGPRPRGSAHPSLAEDQLLRSPMPGQVRALNVALGQEVQKGQTLLLLEAMKMEIRVQSPRAGRLKRLLVQQGQTVERDQLLAEIE